MGETIEYRKNALFGQKIAYRRRNLTAELPPKPSVKFSFQSYAPLYLSLTELFNSFDIRTVWEDQLDRFEAEVEQEAHPYTE